MSQFPKGILDLIHHLRHPEFHHLQQQDAHFVDLIKAASLSPHFAVGTIDSANCFTYPELVYRHLESYYSFSFDCFSCSRAVVGASPTNAHDCCVQMTIATRLVKAADVDAVITASDYFIHPI